MSWRLGSVSDSSAARAARTSQQRLRPAHPCCCTVPYRTDTWNPAEVAVLDAAGVDVRLCQTWQTWMQDKVKESKIPEMDFQRHMQKSEAFRSDAGRAREWRVLSSTSQLFSLMVTAPFSARLSTLKRIHRGRD